MLRNIASRCGIREIKQQNSTLFLYKDQIDMKQVGALISAMRGRIMLNAGAKPYVSVKIREQDEPLSLLTEVLEVIGKTV